MVFVQDETGNQLTIGPVYTVASLERLRQEVSDYGWTVAAAVSPTRGRTSPAPAAAERDS